MTFTWKRNERKKNKEKIFKKSSAKMTKEEKNKKIIFEWIKKEKEEKINKQRSSEKGKKEWKRRKKF